MQPRLTRSRTDKIFAGVCGGLGEYFAIDPVIVRLIFVLVTLTSGLGLPVYVVLWIIMPRSTGPMVGSVPPEYQQQAREQQHQADLFGDQATYRGSAALRPESHEAVHARSPQSVQSGRPTGVATPRRASMYADEYQFDPQTGQPVQPGRPATGETVKLEHDPSEAYARSMAATNEPGQPAPAPRRKNWRTLGFILIGIGFLIVLEQLSISTAFIFPVLLIVAGVILLKRR